MYSICFAKLIKAKFHTKLQYDTDTKSSFLNCWLWYPYITVFVITIILLRKNSFRWATGPMVLWLHLFCFVWYTICVEVLWPSQPNRVMSSAASSPNITFTGQAYSSMWLSSIVHILLQEIDNCPSWISGRERMTIENILWSSLRLGGVKLATSWSHPTAHGGLLMETWKKC